jgi:hypothetical protein
MIPERTPGTRGLTVSAIELGLVGMTHACGTADERDDRPSIAPIPQVDQ